MRLFEICVVVVALLLAHEDALQAGVVDPPIVTEVFPTGLQMSITALNAWTGMGDVPVTITGQGPTTVQREQATNAFNQGGLDTIDTEIVDMQLTGTSSVGPPVQIRVGAGNGFLPGLPRTGGQVQENAANPQDGNLAIPPDANSIFDVFFDVWIDLNMDNIVDVGEVVRNEHGLRLRNPNLSSLPPALDGSDAYQTFMNGIVDNADPNLGMFNATMFLGPQLDLRVVGAGGALGAVHATLDPAASHMHTPNPEPSTLALFGVGLAGAAACSWRKRRKQQQQA